MTTMLSTVDERKFERIARLHYHNVSATEIARVVNLSEGRISQIFVDPRYQEIYSQVAAEKIESAEETDTSWDAIEKLATKGIAEFLQWNKDPDYMLKAAMVANKAVRKNGNQGIAADTGARAVIQLSANFVNAINDNGGAAPERQVTLLRDQNTNSATPKQVEALLQPPAGNKEKKLSMRAMAENLLADVTVNE